MSPRETAPEKPEEAPKEAPKEAPEAAAATAAAPSPAPAAPAPAAAAPAISRPSYPSTPSAPNSIIKIDPATLNFVDGCSTFFPSGINIWEAVEVGRERERKIMKEEKESFLFSSTKTTHPQKLLKKLFQQQHQQQQMGFGAKNLWAASLPSGTTGPALLRDVLDSAAAAKFNVMRILSHGVNKESDMTLNGISGQFNDNVAKGLDYVIAEAGKRGIR